MGKPKGQGTEAASASCGRRPLSLPRGRRGGGAEEVTAVANGGAKVPTVEADEGAGGGGPRRRLRRWRTNGASDWEKGKERA